MTANEPPLKIDRPFSRYVLGITPFLVGEAFQQAIALEFDWVVPVYIAIGLFFLLCAVFGWTLDHDDVTGKRFLGEWGLALALAIFWVCLSLAMNTWFEGLGLLILTGVVFTTVLVWFLAKVSVRLRNRKKPSSAGTA